MAKRYGNLKATKKMWCVEEDKHTIFHKIFVVDYVVIGLLSPRRLIGNVEQCLSIVRFH